MTSKNVDTGTHIYALTHSPILPILSSNPLNNTKLVTLKTWNMGRLPAYRAHNFPENSNKRNTHSNTPHVETDLPS